MKIRINGEERLVDEGATLAEMLAAAGYEQKYIAVEYNGGVIMADDYATVVLKDGDKLEIVRFVGGG